MMLTLVAIDMVVGIYLVVHGVRRHKLAVRCVGAALVLCAVALAVVLMLTG